MALSKEFIKKMKTHLLSEKKRLEADLADYITKHGNQADVAFPEYGDHNGENAAEVMSYDNALAVKNTLEKELRDINNALKRIEDGSYGICKYCHQPIAEKRLEARPTSSTCINCKKKFSGEE